jgi:hypothetical protein
MPDARALPEVVRAGWYRQSGHRRQRWWCGGRGELHGFIEVLPRIAHATDIHAKRHRTSVRVSSAPVIWASVHMRGRQEQSVALSEDPDGRGQDTAGGQVPHSPRRPLLAVRAGCIRSAGLRAGLPRDV